MNFWLPSSMAKGSSDHGKEQMSKDSIDTFSVLSTLFLSLSLPYGLSPFYVSCSLFGCPCSFYVASSYLSFVDSNCPCLLNNLKSPWISIFFLWNLVLSLAIHILPIAPVYFITCYLFGCSYSFNITCSLFDCPYLFYFTRSSLSFVDPNRPCFLYNIFSLWLSIFFLCYMFLSLICIS